MQSFVALLRAVNVGGTGKLPMADLRAMASDAGLADVRTYIQSGNLLFRSDQPDGAVKAALEQRLADYAGKPIGVILRSAEAMQQVLRSNPFPAAAPAKLGVLFLDAPPATDIAEGARGRADEEIRPGQREVFIHYPSGMGASKLRMAALDQGTMRNLNTVAKLVQLAAA